MRSLASGSAADFLVKAAGESSSVEHRNEKKILAMDNSTENSNSSACSTIKNVAHHAEFAEDDEKTEITNVGTIPPLRRALNGRSNKKLLVLDLNGLLVFKKAFHDDFLQFCFEKFNVGVYIENQEECGVGS
ncbi:hypothetical protein HAX54_024102 [Datura stramonium]|uniref:FCP1 homology domain-containing protein n=1 Tax=Datura stramonium TaxID=4076 RepID=A0ABS8UZG6_DATST|nr:hypothetical protein [Datura stramonium]